MRTTSLCIQGVTEKSPYAYRDAKIPVCIRGLVSIRSPYAYKDCVNPRMHTGIKINPRMHTGITYKSPYAYRDQDVIPVCIWGFARSPYAFVIIHGAVHSSDGGHCCQCWQRRWPSSSTMVVVDGGGGGMEPTAPIVVIDSGGKDAIAAAAIDRRHIRQ